MRLLGMLCAMVLLGCSVPMVSDRCRTSDDCLPWRACVDGRCDGEPVITSSSSADIAASSSSGSSSSSGGTCEAGERYVVVVNDQDAPIQVHRPSGGLIVPLVPAGFTPGAGALEANGFTPSPEALTLLNGKILVVAPPKLYAVNASTLVQTDLTATQRTVNFSSDTLTHLNDVLLGFDTIGIEYAHTNEASWTVQSGNGAATRALVISVGGTPMVAAASYYDVSLWSVTRGATPARVARSPMSRLEEWDDTYYGRALAYDEATDTLLVGLMDGVALFHTQDSLTVPPEATDWKMPSDDLRAYAAFAKDGIAWVASPRRLYRVDLSTSPPATLGTVDTDGNATRAQDVMMGCERLLVLTNQGLYGFDPVTLARRGSVSIPGTKSPEHMLVVRREALNITGDE